MTTTHKENPAWLHRLGLAGFAFFFIKGMLWLSLPLLIARFSL